MDSAACWPVAWYKRNVSLRLVVKWGRQFTEDYWRTSTYQRMATSRFLSKDLTCHHKGNFAMKRTYTTTVFVRENWACNSLNPKEEYKISLQTLFSKGTAEHWPCCLFFILYLQGASEGRYLSCFDLPHSRSSTKADLHPHDSASSCSQGCTAHNSPNTQARLLVCFSF